MLDNETLEIIEKMEYKCKLRCINQEKPNNNKYFDDCMLIQMKLYQESLKINTIIKNTKE